MAEMQDTIATEPETIKVLITDRIAREGIALLSPGHSGRVGSGERGSIAHDPAKLSKGDTRISRVRARALLVAGWALVVEDGVVEVPPLRLHAIAVEPQGCGRSGAACPTAGIRLAEVM